MKHQLTVLTLIAVASAAPTEPQDLPLPKRAVSCTGSNATDLECIISNAAPMITSILNAQCRTKCTSYVDILECYLKEMPMSLGTNLTQASLIPGAEDLRNATWSCQRQQCLHMDELHQCTECLISELPQAAARTKAAEEYNADLPKMQKMCADLGYNVSLARVSSGSLSSPTARSLLVAVVIGFASVL